MEYIEKDVTTVERGIIVHGCNAQGVMGSGVAGALRKKWPQIFDGYKMLCDGYELQRQSLLGCSHFVTIVPKTLLVGNLITQLSFGRDGKRYADVDAIKKGFEIAAMVAVGINLPLYMPKIGCGLGGLNWEVDVLPVIEQVLRDNQVREIYICDIGK